MKEKKQPGRPRIHEIGAWSSVHVRLPLKLRDELFQILELTNKDLAYRLSLNSLLLDLIQKGLTVKGYRLTQRLEEYGSEKEKTD